MTRGGCRAEGGEGPQIGENNRECARANIDTHLRLKAKINIVYRPTINRLFNPRPPNGPAN